MSDTKLTVGKYAGRHISDLCRDRRYMNWVMTTWTSGALPKDIHAYIELQKTLVKKRHTSRNDPDFVKDWLAVSYEGYKIGPDDLEWVQDCLRTSKTDISLGFIRSEYVFRVDGEEFALRPLAVNERQDVFAAYRNDIQDQITEFRRKCFHNKVLHRCPETGIYLKNDMDTHTDHHFRKKTFVNLVEAFNAEHAVGFEHVEIENCGMFYRLRDRTLAQQWASYHREHAVLRLIHSSANTNAAYYLKKYDEPPFERPARVIKKREAAPAPVKTFDDLLKNT